MHFIKNQSIVMFLIISLLSISTFGSEKQYPLKGQNHFIEGIDEYRVLVKFAPEYVPDLDEFGNLTLHYQNPRGEILAPIKKYNLTFTRVVDFTDEQLEKLKTPQRHIPDEKGFNIFEFAGLLNVHSTYSSKGVLLDICNELEALSEVEYAELQPIAEFPSPADIPPTTPSLDSAQGYLGPNPGIDAKYAWSQGIKGEGMQVCDIEYYKGTAMSHEDLVDQGIQWVLPMPNGSSQPHAIAVMGVLVAGENGYGITGGAPKTSAWVGPEEHGRAKTALAAIEKMKKGDVILYEMQTTGAGGGYCPADYSQSLWDATKKGTDAGVIIVAAAGNGNQDLDSPSYASYINRGDNGSIIVGAGTSNTSHNKLSFSTYGKRVNVQGWGQNVYTLATYGQSVKFGNDINQAYGAGFSGTSSASPIVTVATLLIQNYYKTKYNSIFTPREMRDLLMNTGTAQGSGGHIGPIPNVKAAFEWIDAQNTNIENVKKNSVVKNAFYQHNNLIKYTVPQNLKGGESLVNIKLYSMSGKLVGNVFSGLKKAGTYEIDMNTYKSGLSSGLYFCKMAIGNQQYSMKYRVNRR